jgi:head-tail adaptor
VTYAGQMNRKVTFRRQTRDVNGEASGYEDVVTREARVQPLKGGEGVQASRLAGKQPVVIFVRRDNTTKLIDNGWQAYDTRAAADSPPVYIRWDVTSVIVSEDLKWVEAQAIQHLGGDVE